MADKTFNLKIISPTRVFYDDQVDMVENLFIQMPGTM